MVKKRRIIVFTGFNRAKFSQMQVGDGHRTNTEEWIQYRFNIWKKYTWQSILNQTYWKWDYCLCCDPATRSIVDHYFGKIKDKRFHIMYEETDHERMIMNMLAQRCTQIVNVRLDSDDMYHPDAIQELTYALDNEAYDWFQWQHGFGYEYCDGIGVLKKYRPGHKSGPFFARRFNKGEWLKGTLRMGCQHQLVKKKNPMILSNGKILVGLHGINTSTSLRAKCFKGQIRGPRKTEVLREFKLL